MVRFRGKEVEEAGSRGILKQVRYRLEESS